MAKSVQRSLSLIYHGEILMRLCYLIWRLNNCSSTARMPNYNCRCSQYTGDVKGKVSKQAGAWLACPIFAVSLALESSETHWKWHQKDFLNVWFLWFIANNLHFRFDSYSMESKIFEEDFSTCRAFFVSNKNHQILNQTNDTQIGQKINSHVSVCGLNTYAIRWHLWWILLADELIPGTCCRGKNEKDKANEKSLSQSKDVSHIYVCVLTISQHHLSSLDLCAGANCSDTEM